MPTKTKIDHEYIDAERLLLADVQGDHAAQLEDMGTLEKARQIPTEAGSVQPGELDADNPLVSVALVNKQRMDSQSKNYSVYDEPNIRFTVHEQIGDTGVIQNRLVDVPIAEVRGDTVEPVAGFEIGEALFAKYALDKLRWAKEQGILTNLEGNLAEIGEKPSHPMEFGPPPKPEPGLKPNGRM